MPTEHATKGDRIRTLRQARGLSQDALAKQVGVTKAAVMQWETGRVDNIKNVTFLRLVQVLGTTQEYILFGPGRRGTSRRPLPAASSDDKA